MPPEEPTTPAPEAPPVAPETPPPPPPAASEPEGNDEPLGEAGKRALEAERLAHKEAKRKLREFETQVEELRTAQMSEHEKAVAEARKAGEQDATTKVQSRLFSAEAKLAASGKLADPSLLADPDVARKLLGLAEIPVTADGDIDSEAISQAIDRLVQVRPYLAATPGATPKPTGAADGGPQGGSQPGQLSRADLNDMTPDQITEAKAKGLLNDVLGIS